MQCRQHMLGEQMYIFFFCWSTLSRATCALGIQTLTLRKGRAGDTIQAKRHGGKFISLLCT